MAVKKKSRIKMNSNNRKNKIYDFTVKKNAIKKSIKIFQKNVAFLSTIFRQIQLFCTQFDRE